MGSSINKANTISIYGTRRVGLSALQISNWLKFEARSGRNRCGFFYLLFGRFQVMFIYQTN